MRFVFQIYCIFWGFGFQMKLLFTTKEDTETYSHAKYIAYWARQN